jgi:acyl dehydratase
MAEKIYFEDFQVGDRLVTPGRTITEADFVLFTAWMGDWRPLHTDLEYARSTSFGERIAPDLMVLAIASGLMFRAGKHAIPASTIAIWGVEGLRFITPVRIGDTVRLESEVVQLTEVDRKRGLMSVRHWGKNQRDEQILTCTTQMLVQRQPLSGDHLGG